MNVSRRAMPLMGGDAELLVVDAPPGAVDRVIGLLRELERRWSRFDPGSDVVRLNDAAPGEPVDVHPATAELLAVLPSLVTETAGAFDPTVLPDLVRAGYASSLRDGRVAPALAAGRTRGRLDGIRIEGTTVRMPGEVTVDLGGVAKGHAAQLAVAELRGAGASGALVSIAGDVAVDGVPPEGGRWRIAVDDPREPGRRLAVLEIVAGAVATSSRVKRRWSAADGTDRHHLIDPRTGEPARTPVVAMTVAAPDGARAEAWAKTGFIHDDAIADAERAGLTALLVLESGDLVETPGWSS